MKKNSVAILAILSLLVCQCQVKKAEEEISFTPVNCNDGWEVSTPEDQDLDSQLLHKAYKDSSNLPYMRSVLVVRNGYLVAERYFHSATIDGAVYVASVTKSFLSALVGIALKEGYIKSVDQPMMDYFPEYKAGTVDQAKYEITIRQLLQMRAGYWHDSQDERWQAWVNSPNWVDYMIHLGLENPPGTQWNYSSGSAHLLAAILTRATNRSCAEFAREHLFEPLGMVLARWGTDPQGINRGGWDIHIKPRCMARFGLLYLNDGQYKGNQVVPQDWVALTTTPRSTVPWPSGALQSLQYCMHWWAGYMRTNRIFMAQGHGGQNIVVIPALNMVVVTTADYNMGFGDSWTQSIATFNLIIQDILAAVRN
jgi:CubicO group peptidase (beta-lactamase class C family)